MPDQTYSSSDETETPVYSCHYSPYEDCSLLELFAALVPIAYTVAMKLAGWENPDGRRFSSFDWTGEKRIESMCAYRVTAIDKCCMYENLGIIHHSLKYPISCLRLRSLTRGGFHDRTQSRQFILRHLKEWRFSTPPSSRLGEISFVRASRSKSTRDCVKPVKRFKVDTL